MFFRTAIIESMIHILFDIDETLLSVPPGLNEKASRVMFNKVFKVDTDEGVIDNIGKTEMGIIQEVLEQEGLKGRATEHESSTVEITEEAYVVWAEAMEQELKEHPVKILPGMTEILKNLSMNPNVKLGLLTGNSPWRSEAKLKSAGLDSYFRDENGKLIGVFGNISPRRSDLFDVVKKEANNEDKFIIIDDSLIAARMAQEHKIPIILVATGKASEEELKPFSPHVFPDFGENRWQEAIKIIDGT